MITQKIAGSNGTVKKHTKLRAGFFLNEAFFRVAVKAK